LRTGILYMAAWVEPWLGAHRVGARSLHPYHPTLVPPLVEAAHQQGLEVYPFTVGEPRRLEELAKMGVDGLITNQPGLDRAVVGGLPAAGARLARWQGRRGWQVPAAPDGIEGGVGV